MADDRDYKVGYGKPPKHSQFPPGQSGNPKGRRKGARGLKSDLEEELNAVRSITNKSDGTKTKGRQQRLAIKMLCMRASVGDLKAQAILFPLILQIFGVEDRGTGRAKLSTQDQAILDALLDGLSMPEGEPEPGDEGEGENPSSESHDDDPAQGGGDDG